MNNVEISLVHGKRQKIRQGLAKQSCVFALSAGLLLAAWAPLTARADSTPITQLQFLQWVAQLSGSGSQFNHNSSSGDYVNWAKSIGLNGNWSPQSHLDRDTLAASLGSLFNISPSKGSSDYIRPLQKAGIDVSHFSGNVTKDQLVSLLDQFTVSARFAALFGNKQGQDNHRPTDDPKHKDRDDDDHDRGHHTTKPPEHHPVTICHKGHTIVIDQKALAKHLAHGDTLGPCHVTKHHHDRDDDDHDGDHDSHGH